MPSPAPERFAPPAPVTRPTVHRVRRRPGWLLPAALVGVLGLVILAVALAAGGDGGERADNADPAAREAGSSGDGERSSDPAQPSPEDQPGTPAPSSPQDSGGGETPSTGGGAPSGATTSGAGAAALNEKGFGLLNAGRYDEAIPVLQRAYDACGQSVENLTCAYAAFNLGKALRLGGRPDEAIPVLEKRLKYPDQRDTVQTELDAAKTAAQG